MTNCYSLNIQYTLVNNGVYISNIGNLDTIPALTVVAESYFKQTEHRTQNSERIAVNHVQHIYRSGPFIVSYHSDAYCCADDYHIFLWSLNVEALGQSFTWIVRRAS